MSAILVLAEMAKMHIPGYPLNSNFLDFSFKTSTGIFLPSTGSLRKDCICNNQELNMYLEQIKKTRYWDLVNC